MKKLNERWRPGFLVTAPLGGGVNYGAQRVELAAIALSPSLGYRVNERLSVGAGVLALYTQVQRVDCHQQSRRHARQQGQD